MPGLSARHARKLLEIAERIYSAQDFQQFTHSLFATIPELISADMVAYNEMDPVRRKSLDIVSLPEGTDAEMTSIWRQYMHEHPFVEHFRRSPDRSARSISDLLSIRQYHRLALYNEFFRPMGIEEGLGSVLEVHWPVLVGVGLTRQSWGCSTQERMLFNLLMPHIAQAWRNVRALTNLAEELRALERLPEALGLSVILLNQAGRMRLATPHARALLARFFPDFSARGEILPGELRRWHRRLQVQDAANGVLPPRRPLIVEVGGGRLRITLLSHAGQCLLQLEEVGPLTLLREAQKFGLTKREGEVLSWIAQGKSNAEIAIILDLSSFTVKRHVENILTKLDAPNRSAAIAIAARPIGKS